MGGEEKRRGRGRGRAVGESDAKSAQKSSDAVETEGEKVSGSVLDNKSTVALERKMIETRYIWAWEYSDYLSYKPLLPTRVNS